MPTQTAESDQARADVFVSIVAVVDAATDGIAGTVTNLYREVSTRYENYEIILVDNGLRPAELIALREALRQLACIRVLRLTRRFPIDSAIFAGLEAAIGDYIVVMSPGNDPLENIARIIQLNQDGSDIVQGVSSAPIGGSWVSRIGRNVFYWYNRRYLRVDIPTRATLSFGFTRRAVNTLTATARSHRYLRHLVRHVGYQIAEFTYEPEKGTVRQRTMKSGYIEAVEMISSYSTHPLRAITVLGALTALFNLIYAVYVIVIRLAVADVVQGWTTTSLQLSLMFFVICTVLAVQSEYIGRILTETRREPSYVIMEELESETLIADLHRRNVSS
jgi:glycosyltransferase involved in cell wall biosynthesis